MARDASLGAHNPKYTRQIIYDAFFAITGHAPSTIVTTAMDARGAAFCGWADLTAIGALFRRWLVVAAACVSSSCSEERPVDKGPPVYDVEIAPVLQKRCIACHQGETPSGGWRATSYLETIACVASNGAPATVPPDERAPILRVLDTDSHRALLDANERSLLEGWVRAKAPSSHPVVHGPGIADPRSLGWHGKLLRDKRWAPMLDGSDTDACGRCHEGSPARPPDVLYPAKGATACTSCHTESGGALACGTCHGDGERSYPPRDLCFFPGDSATAGAHAARTLRRHPPVSPARRATRCPAPRW